MPILEDGQLFERYRVHRWLGSGIAGESYEAEDRILQRKVTLKLIHPWSPLSDSARRQFFREMQGISLLNHPYLATVLDYGETDGHMYVARRYVSSGSLLSNNGRQWFHPPLPVGDAFTYAHQLAQALQYIHQHGYLHGSLTFANVLVLRGPNTENDTNYAPFLMADVGLANFVRRFGQPRLETVPISTAPEQISKRVAPASDQFALAVLLYFWLTGRPPYLGSPQEVEQQKLSETITPLSLLNPGISLEQDTIILRALTAYPEDRYPSALAFAEELRTSLNAPSRRYAHAVAPQPEQPQAQPQISGDEHFADLAKIEPPASVDQSTPGSSENSGAKQVSSDSLSQPQESYRSALEELLAHPQSAPSEDPAASESAQHVDEEIQQAFPGDQHEEMTLLPVLPDTPPVEELPEQIEFALIASNDPTAAQEQRQTGPLVGEPPIDILHAQIDETALQMPLDLPESVDSFAPDELSSADPTESSPGSWPDEVDPSNEENIPTVPHEEFVRAMREQELLLADDRTPRLSSEFTQPAQEASQAHTQKDFSVDEEGFVVFSPDELTSFNEMISPVVFPDEPLPISETPPDTTLEAQAAIPAEPLAGALAAPLDIENLSPEAPAQSHQETQESAASSSQIVNSQEAQTPGSTESVQEPTRTVSDNETEAPGMQRVDLDKDDETLPAISLEQSVQISEEALPGDTLAEESFANEEDIPTNPQTRNIFQSDDAPLLTEEPQEQLIIDPPALELEEVQKEEERVSPSISAPLQEAPETSKVTYPPIDEAIIAPRLLISSPYTSSSYEFLLLSEETNIGRAGASDLYLEQDNLTSRHHALLKRAGERILLFDKHSHNGVFLNGQKIEAGRGYELADGDHIGIGNYELIFRSAPAGHVSQLI